MKSRKAGKVSNKRHSGLQYTSDEYDFWSDVRRCETTGARLTSVCSSLYNDLTSFAHGVRYHFRGC